MDPHQRCASLVLEFVDVVVCTVLCHFEQQLAGKRVAVGMEPVRWQTNENVSDLDRVTGDDLVAIDHTDNSAGKVIFTLGIETGHLGRLAADECAAIGPTGIRKALNDGLDDGVRQLPGGEVVEEEEWGSTLHSNVINTVIDKILANCVVDTEFECNLKLSAYTIA